jgi:hypothetical protein
VTLGENRETKSALVLTFLGKVDRDNNNNNNNNINNTFLEPRHKWE